MANENVRTVSALIWTPKRSLIFRPVQSGSSYPPSVWMTDGWKFKDRFCRMYMNTEAVLAFLDKVMSLKSLECDWTIDENIRKACVLVFIPKRSLNLRTNRCLLSPLSVTERWEKNVRTISALVDINTKTVFTFPFGVVVSLIAPECDWTKHGRRWGVRFLFFI